MKTLLLASLLAFSSCSMLSFGDAELPVTEIKARADTIIETMESADLNNDGVIKGNAEWFALGHGVVALVVKWAAERSPTPPK